MDEDGSRFGAQATTTNLKSQLSMGIER